ncbi:helix-turn-helix domain-containing protein [Paenibacillus sp. HB172176]|uniref:helix-turn-helix domain-containing protein n=1 Tax=Paenibacillus sp. HB172176 TaxID=2493690 RepID=UPI00143B4D1A|nr:helix-turn-helix domain-containing protein [Paenibacillus sp. HB172176]
MENRKRKSHLFYQFLISHILIFAIPFTILSCVVYYNAVVSFKGEVESSNMFKLDQLKKTFDLMAKGLDKTASRISIDSDLTPFNVRNGSYNGVIAKDKLATYKDSNVIAEEIALYFHGDDRLYTSVGMSTLETFFSSIYPVAASDADSLMMDLDHLHSPELLRLPAPSNKQQANILVYAVPIPRNSQSPYGTVVFFLSESMLTEFADPILGDFIGGVYISDSKGDLFASKSTGIALAEADINHLLSRYDLDGVYNASIDKERYSMMRENSEATGWSYAVVMPTSQFIGRVLEMRTFILIVCAVVVTIGLSIAFLLSRRQYRPIRGVADRIRSLHALRDGANESKHELDVLWSSVESTREMIEQLDYQRPIVREQFFFKLLKGMMKDAGEIETNASREDLVWRGELFFVAVISIDSDEYIPTQNREGLLRTLSAVPLPDAVGYGVEMTMEQAIVMLVNTDCEPSGMRQIQETAASELSQLFEGCCGFKPMIGLGNAVSALTNVNRSFIEACAALETNVKSRSGSILFFNDISDLKERHDWYPAEEQIRLVQSMKQGNEEAANAALEAILLDLQGKDSSLFMFRCMSFDLVNTCLKAISELKLTLLKGHVSLLTEFTSLEQLRQAMTGMIADICKQVEASKQNKNHELGEQILRYVGDHFKEYDLNLERIADHFQMSLSYFSRFMKEQTGYTFSEYVADLRMEEVKRQLKQTGQPIKDIVAGVGYADVPNFIRKFKNAEGITPGQYRKLHS